jgi:hypothetical protein
MRAALILTTRLLTLTFGPWAPAAFPTEAPPGGEARQEQRTESVRLYRNEDLPSPLLVASTVTGGHATLPEAPQTPELLPISPLDERGWRARALELRRQIRQEERNEYTFRSFLACAEEGMDIAGPGCHPRVNRVNLGVTGITLDPSNPRLRGQLLDSQLRLVSLLDQWRELEEEARRSGVPPEWLDEGLDEPPPRRLDLSSR